MASFVAFSQAHDAAVVGTPSGLAEGDLLLLCATCAAGYPEDPQVPTGFTDMGQSREAGSGLRQRVSRKIATAEDAAAVTLSAGSCHESVQYRHNVMVAFREVEFVDHARATVLGVATAATATGVTPSEAAAHMAFIFVSACSGSIPTYSDYAVATDNPTWTEIEDTTDRSWLFGTACAYSATRASATGTGVFSAVGSGAAYVAMIDGILFADAAPAPLSDSTLFSAARNDFAEGTTHWLASAGSNIKAVLVNADIVAPDPAVHTTMEDFRSAVVSDDISLTLSDPVAGACAAETVRFTGVTGDAVHGLLIYREDSSADAGRKLLAWVKFPSTIDPNGGDVEVQWDPAGIFTL